METKKLQSTLDSFRKYVIQQSRSNLSRTDKNVSKQLYNSINGKFKVSKNSIEGYFEMEKYGEFQDKGVKGFRSSSKAPNSPFQFGKSFGSGNGGLTKGIENWVTRRRLQFKDRQTGKFLTYKSTAFIITRSIYAKGIKPSEFFSKPFEAGFKKLPDDLIESYGLDVETFLKYTLKDNGKTN
jgi:hypothetical protein